MWLLACCIAEEANLEDNGPFGSGRSSEGFGTCGKYFKIDILNHALSRELVCIGIARGIENLGGESWRIAIVRSRSPGG